MELETFWSDLNLHPIVGEALFAVHSVDLKAWAMMKGGDEHEHLKIVQDALTTASKAICAAVGIE